MPVMYDPDDGYRAAMPGQAGRTVADTCRHCGKPIARCEEFSPHTGCSSGYGWIHLEPDWGHHCPVSRNKPYERQYARP